MFKLAFVLSAFAVTAFPAFGAELGKKSDKLSPEAARIVDEFVGGFNQAVASIENLALRPPGGISIVSKTKVRAPAPEDEHNCNCGDTLNK